MKYFAVIDTNVLVSAMLKHQSVPGNILDMVFSGIITPVLNYNIESEYRDVISSPTTGTASCTSPQCNPRNSLH
ncbi:PIN domain-containing protein [Oribacterium sinus]